MWGGECVCECKVQFQCGFICPWVFHKLICIKKGSAIPTIHCLATIIRKQQKQQKPHQQTYRGEASCVLKGLLTCWKMKQQKFLMHSLVLALVYVGLWFLVLPMPAGGKKEFF